MLESRKFRMAVIGVLGSVVALFLPQIWPAVTPAIANTVATVIMIAMGALLGTHTLTDIAHLVTSALIAFKQSAQEELGVEVKSIQETLQDLLDALFTGDETPPA